MENVNVPLFYILLSITLIIMAILYVKDLQYINYNNKYNIIFILSNIIITTILLRGLLDTKIISNVMFIDDVNNYNNYRMKYVANNIIYFNIIYIVLNLYLFTFEKIDSNKL